MQRGNETSRRENVLMKKKKKKKKKKKRKKNKNYSNQASRVLPDFAETVSFFRVVRRRVTVPALQRQKKRSLGKGICLRW